MDEKNNVKGIPACCMPDNGNDKKPSGLAEGIIYGLIPHTGCIAFIAFAILGATTMSALFQPLLMDRNFFYGLISLSLAFATLSAVIYLNKRGLLSLQGISQAKGYLSLLYGTTAAVNLLFFFVVFPMLTNAIPVNSYFAIDAQSSALACPINAAEPTCQVEDSLSGSQASGKAQAVAQGAQPAAATMRIEVDIPCSGHAPLIRQELSKVQGITNIAFQGFNQFEITYDPSKVSKSGILDIAIFKTYPAREI